MVSKCSKPLDTISNSMDTKAQQSCWSAVKEKNIKRLFRREKERKKTERKEIRKRCPSFLTCNQSRQIAISLALNPARTEFRIDGPEVQIGVWTKSRTKQGGYRGADQCMMKCEGYAVRFSVALNNVGGYWRICKGSWNAGIINIHEWILSSDKRKQKAPVSDCNADPPMRDVKDWSSESTQVEGFEVRPSHMTRIGSPLLWPPARKLSLLFAIDKL